MCSSWKEFGYTFVYLIAFAFGCFVKYEFAVALTLCVILAKLEILRENLVPGNKDCCNVTKS